MKYCSACDSHKPVDCFSLNKTRKDGRTSTCKECMRLIRGKRSVSTCQGCSSPFRKKRPDGKFCSFECFARTTDRTGENNPSWKGGTLVDHGYVYVRSPGHHRARGGGGYVKRADLVAEKEIGRPLTHSEVVHHKNRIRDDDSPENLQVLTKVEHDRLHANERAELRRIRRKPRPIKNPKKVVLYPPIPELSAWVKATSLRVVAKELGCSHIAVRTHLKKHSPT
jgi:hypothetical protein